MNVLILTEGTSVTGYGHASRMKSVAQAARHLGWSVQIAGNLDSKGLDIFSGFETKTIPWQSEVNETLALCRSSDLVVLDSYLASEETYLQIKQALNGQTKMLCVDDYGRINYPDCSIVNYSIGATPALYTRQTGQKEYFLGPQYALLSEAFWHFTPAPRQPSQSALRVTVTFGGADAKNLGVRTSNLLSEYFPELEIHAIFPNTQALENPDRHPGILNHAFLTQEELRDLFCASDFCVTAGGHTTYEIGCTATPMIAIKSAENQDINIAGWKKAGIPVIDSIGENYSQDLKQQVSKFFDTKFRSIISAKAKALVRPDGSLNLLKKIIQ